MNITNEEQSGQDTPMLTKRETWLWQMADLCTSRGI